MTINRCMDKQNVICLYNRVLFCQRKEWSSDIYYSVDEPQKHYANWKEASHKRPHIMYNDSIGMKSPEQEKFMETESRSVVSRGQKEGKSRNDY